MSDQRILQQLGLIKRAGKLVTGTDACMTSIRSGQAQLAIVAKDTGDNAMKKYRDKCAYYNVPILELFDKVTLGHAVGKSHGAILVVTDKGFAQRIRQMSEGQ